MIWTESGDVSEYLDASELRDDDDDIIDVDAEAVEIFDEEEKAEERPRAYRLPTPSLPPRRPSLQSLPPTAFAPQPIKIKPLPLPLPPPVAPPVRDITPAPPVVEMDEALAKADDAPPSRRRYPRPTWPWAAALVSLGAAAGFAISILTQVASGVATDEAQLTSAPVAAAPALEAPTIAATPRVETQPKTLRFDTPLDIRVPAAAPAEPPPAPPTKTEVASKPAPKPPVVAPPPKQPEPPKAVEREPENTFVRAPTRPAPRRDLPPQAVDALVREQLSTALR